MRPGCSLRIVPPIEIVGPNVKVFSSVRDATAVLAVVWLEEKQMF
jgi:hypothetical protein